MNPNNLFLKWLQETVQRLFKKSPLFFKIWTGLSSLVLALTGLPDFITSLGIKLPPAAMVLESKVAAYISMGALFMSLMPAKENLNSISPQGVVNKQASPKAMPFTVAVEVKQAIKEGKPLEQDAAGNSFNLPGSPPNV